MEVKEIVSKSWRMLDLGSVPEFEDWLAGSEVMQERLWSRRRFLQKAFGVSLNTFTIADIVGASSSDWRRKVDLADDSSAALIAAIRNGAT